MADEKPELYGAAYEAYETAVADTKAAIQSMCDDIQRYDLLEAAIECEIKTVKALFSQYILWTENGLTLEEIPECRTEPHTSREFRMWAVNEMIRCEDIDKVSASIRLKYNANKKEAFAKLAALQAMFFESWQYMLDCPDLGVHTTAQTFREMFYHSQFVKMYRSRLCAKIYNLEKTQKIQKEIVCARSDHLVEIIRQQYCEIMFEQHNRSLYDSDTDSVYSVAVSCTDPSGDILPANFCLILRLHHVRLSHNGGSKIYVHLYQRHSLKSPDRFGIWYTLQDDSPSHLDYVSNIIKLRESYPKAKGTLYLNDSHGEDEVIINVRFYGIGDYDMPIALRACTLELDGPLPHSLLQFVSPTFHSVVDQYHPFQYVDNLNNVSSYAVYTKLLYDMYNSKPKHDIDVDIQIRKKNYRFFA